jgi:SAM-dependent methyltransferase
MTTRDEARAFFDSIAGRYDRVYAPPRDESRARNARVLAELAPRSRVLDLGVGTGRELSALMDAGHFVTGLDLSPEMLARCARRSRPIPLIQANLWDPLPFAAASFDAVLGLHGTLAHPPSESAPRALGAEVSRVLSRDGVFVFEVPLPTWIAGHAGDPERKLVRLSETRARVTDTTTGATIETLLLSSSDWRAALSPSLTVTKAIEDTSELFLVAGQLAPAR